MASERPSEDTQWYLVTEKTHYINGQLYEPGEKVQYAGTPGKHLVKIDGADAPVPEIEQPPETSTSNRQKPPVRKSGKAGGDLDVI